MLYNFLDVKQCWLCTFPRHQIRGGTHSSNTIMVFVRIWPFSLLDGCSAFWAMKYLFICQAQCNIITVAQPHLPHFPILPEWTQSRLQGHIKTTTGSEQVLNVSWLSITRSGIHHFSIASSTKKFYSFSARSELSFQERFNVSGDAVISVRTECDRNEFNIGTTLIQFVCQELFEWVATRNKVV